MESSKTFLRAREGDVAGGGGLPLSDDLDDLAAHGVQGDVHRLQRLGGHPLALVNEAEEEVPRCRM